MNLKYEIVLNVLIYLTVGLAKIAPVYIKELCFKRKIWMPDERITIQFCLPKLEFFNYDSI